MENERLFNKYSMLTKVEAVFFVLTVTLVFFSMFAAASFPFFVNFKFLLALTILWLLVAEKPQHLLCRLKLTKYALFLIPTFWGIFLGIWNENKGVMNEIPLYGYGMISYLIIFGVLSFRKNILTAFKVAVVLSSLAAIIIFFWLYFFHDGSLRNYLSNLIIFVIQHPQDYVKIHSVQTTSLLFLTPVMLGFFYFERNVFNGLIVSVLVLMLFLSGRRSAIILFLIVTLVLAISNYVATRSVYRVLKFVAPFILSCVMFVSFVKYLETSTTSAALANSVSDAFAIVDTSQAADKYSNDYHSNSRKSKSGSLIDITLHAAEEVESLPVNMCSFDVYSKAGIDAGKIGSAIRQSQANILYKEIKASLFWGHGFGYVVRSCMRSEQQPWRFELTYLSLAMNVGLVGFLMFAASYLIWLKSAIRIHADRGIAYSLLGGSVFFIICGSTNPYLLSVENVWIFFLPYLIALMSDHENFYEVDNAFF